MFRTHWFVPVAVLAALALTLPATAQDRGGRGQGGRGRQGFGGGFGGFGRELDKPTLLGSEQVLAEIKATDEQKKKIEEILTSYREASRELFTGQGRLGRDATPEEREKRRDEMTKKREELLKATDEKIAKALEKDQVKRLDQIIIQDKGVDALVMPTVVASLKLPEEKVNKLKSAIEKRDEALEALFPARGRGGRARGQGGDGGAGGDRPNFEEIREKREAIQKEATTACLALLSESEKKAFDELKGKEFELDRSTLFRGRFGGGRGGPGGDGAGRGPGGGRGGAGGGQGRGQGGERRRPPVDGGDEI